MSARSTWISRIRIVAPLAAALYLGAAAVSPAAWAHVHSSCDNAVRSGMAIVTFQVPDANLWSAGEPTVQGAVLSVGLRPLGPAGTYPVNYRVTSADGHAVAGSWSFRLTLPGTGTPGPAAAPADPDGDVPTWPFAVGAIAAVAAVAIWSVRRRP